MTAPQLTSCGLDVAEQRVERAVDVLGGLVLDRQHGDRRPVLLPSSAGRRPSCASPACSRSASAAGRGGRARCSSRRRRALARRCRAPRAARCCRPRADLQSSRGEHGPRHTYGSRATLHSACPFQEAGPQHGGWLYAAAARSTSRSNERAIRFNTACRSGCAPRTHDARDDAASVSFDSSPPTQRRGPRRSASRSRRSSCYLQSDVIDLHVDSFIWTRVLGYDLRRRHGRGSCSARATTARSTFRACARRGIAGALWSITTNPLRRRGAPRRSVRSQPGGAARHLRGGRRAGRDGARRRRLSRGARAPAGTR